LNPIYVISLKDAVDRRASCREQLASLGLQFEFYDAIEGAALSDQEVSRNYDSGKNATLYKRPLSRPEIGCYMSHLALWRRAAKGENPAAVILEDDFEADPALPRLLQKISALDLGNRIVKLHSEKPVAGEPIANLGGEGRLFAPDRISGFNLGYVIGREAARRLCEKVPPFFRPVDIDLKHWWEFGIAILIVQPNMLELGKLSKTSSIERSRKAIKSSAKLGYVKRFYRNLLYQAHYRIALKLAARDRRSRADGD